MTTNHNLKPGDLVQALRTVRPYFHRKSLYRVDHLGDDGTVYLDNGFVLCGPCAIRQYREGRTWRVVAG